MNGFCNDLWMLRVTKQLPRWCMNSFHYTVNSEVKPLFSLLTATDCCFCFLKQFKDFFFPQETLSWITLNRLFIMQHQSMIFQWKNLYSVASKPNRKALFLSFLDFLNPLTVHKKKTIEKQTENGTITQTQQHIFQLLNTQVFFPPFFVPKISSNSNESLIPS